MSFFYDAAFFAYAALALPGFVAKGKHKSGFGERLGRVPAPVLESLAGERPYWLHAVSVGETSLAVRLAPAIKDHTGTRRVIHTCSTPAGREVCARMKAEEDALVYAPFDWSRAVDRFAASVNPRALILLETEIWPNMILGLRKRGVPTVVMNGRISDRAFPKYRAARRLLAPVFGAIAGVGAQDATMRSRFVELGVPAARVRVTGNVKFDWRPTASGKTEAAELGRKLKRPGEFLFVAGSTHEGEEEALFGAHEALRARYAGFRMVVAPRHPERLPSIEAAAARVGTRLERASSLLLGEASRGAGTICILDRMGVLASLYAEADAVFVGGSLVPTGGHNLVEPAFHEKPILFGPHTQNFKEMTEAFLAERAAIRVPDAGALTEAVSRLVARPEERAALGKAARTLVEKHQGAAERNIDAFLGGRHDGRENGGIL